MKNAAYYNYMIDTAAAYAAVEPGEMKELCVRPAGNEVELRFRTDWMRYDCYIDLGGEVLGFLAEPVEECLGPDAA